MRAIILTAGNGTRIRAISHCRSKCMLPVQGRPLLAWHLDRCVDSDQVDAIHMVIHPQETQIQRYFGASYRGVPLSYHVQTDLSTGLVGAIFSVDCPQVMEEPVLLLLGDEYLPQLNLASLLETAQHRPQALLAVVVPTEEPQKIRQNYTVALDKDHLITQAVEKPQTPLSPYIGTGVVYFPRGLLPTFAQCCRSFADAQLVDLILYAHQAYAYPAKTSYWNLNCRETYREMSRNEGETLPYATMTEAFQAVARQHGTTLAVVSGTQQITYAQLAEQSDRFCQRLQALGCQPGHCVALLCGRTVEHLTAVLGIWKAGCHYLPLDEHLPEVRLAYMVEQAQAVAVIAREGLTEATPHFACPILSYADLLAGHAIPLPDLPPVQEHCRQYAYLCFTSGSTGQPKGAIVWQRSLLNLTAQMQKEAFGLLPSERLQVGVTASFAFDLSVQQIFPALLGGHTLHIIPHETKLRPLALAQALDGLDVCDGTPLMMELLNQALATHPEQPFRLKLYLSGGEELKKPILHAFFQRCPHCLVVNCYGPTECTVETTLFPVDAQREGQYDVLPIGRPMKNTRVYLLNEERKFLCPGETGDIWIAGLGVGGGYVNQPELTAQAFCPDLLEPESTMYRTGDRGRWGRDGNLYYAGRQDNQVKFKGYRIELGEIEKTVESVSGVALCKALLTETGGRKKLVAYYTAQAGQSPTQEALYAELLECLPEYMIPQQLIPTEQFQLNHNGKLDKQALVETAPQDPLTAQVLACVGEVCELPLQADRSLITQGVDSLSLLSLLAELEERFSVKLDFAQWNVRMTAQDIAEQVQTAKNRKPERKGSAVRAKGVPALPLQAYLTQVEQMNRRQTRDPLFNLMIYLVNLPERLDTERLNQAFQAIQQTHDAFRLRMTQSGSRFRMTAMQGEPEPIRVLERPEVVRALQWRKGGLLTDLDETAMGWLVPELEDLTWEQPHPFRLLYCKGEGEDLAIFAVHHNLFDYYSLLYFWEELGRRYRTPLPVSPNQNFSDYASQYARFRRTTETREEALFWEERMSHVEPADWKRWMQALPSGSEPTGVTARICFQEKDTLQCCLPISNAQRQLLTAFCVRHQVGEFAALFALLVWQIRKYGVKTPTALLFFTAGRSQVQPFNTLGYFSFLMPYVVNGGEETVMFPAFVRQTETELTELWQREQGFLSLYQQEASQNLIAQSPIFDYQKLYTRAPGTVGSRMRPFECLGVQNPFSFRIFDYGEQAELSILYRRGAVGLQETDVLRLTRTYIKLWNELFQEPNGSDLC